MTSSGFYDSGTYQIGDTITTSKQKSRSRRYRRSTQNCLCASLGQLVEVEALPQRSRAIGSRGAIQVYRNEYNEIYLGAVGQLQFEVFEYRLNNEYGVDIRMEPVSYSVARWVKDKELKALNLSKTRGICS